MKIGAPKETFEAEARVAMTPDSAAQMMVGEFPTAVPGRLLGINPFDQPDVEAAMVAARVATWLKTHQGPALVVAHAGILRGLLFSLSALPQRQVPHFSVPHDRVVLFSRDRVLTI